MLDVGCGSGFVLEVARSGAGPVHGVEPSARCHRQGRRPTFGRRIVQDMMRAGLFADESLSASRSSRCSTTCRPDRATARMPAILRPGGAIMAFNHNVTAWSARLLGIAARSSTSSTPTCTRRRRCGAVHGRWFRGGRVAPVRNTYSIAYLTHLMPLPARAQAAADSASAATPLGRAQLTVPLGNLCLIARRRG